MGILRRGRKALRQLRTHLVVRLRYGPPMALTGDTWGLISPYGIGDTYLLCALSRQLLAGSGDAVSLLARPSHRDVGLLFPEGIARLSALDEVDLPLLRSWRRQGPPRRGIPLVAHPLNLALADGPLPRLHLLDLYRRLFRLPPEAPLLRPTVPPAVCDEALRRFRHLGLPAGRTVLLAPAAASIKTHPQAFWQALVRALRKAGWTVALNTPMATEPLEGTVPLTFPLGEAIPMAELAGWVVSSRSGLCDLLSTARCRLTVIYPRTDSSWSPFQAFSLVDMGLSPDAEEFEFPVAGGYDEASARILAGP